MEASLPVTKPFKKALQIMGMISSPGWGYGPGWGGGYPYVPVVTSYTTGTLIIDMIDPNNPNTSEEIIPIIWSAFLNGLVTGSEASIQTRVTNGINQAFDQSPYLGTN